MKWQTLVCVMLCGLMLSGCVIALGTRQYSCPFEEHHEMLDKDVPFEELEMHEGEFPGKHEEHLEQFEELEMREGEFPGKHEEHLEQRMREMEMRAEQLNEMERHLTERAAELERQAAEIEEREQ